VGKEGGRRVNPPTEPWSPWLLSSESASPHLCLALPKCVLSSYCVPACGSTNSLHTAPTPEELPVCREKQEREHPDSDGGMLRSQKAFPRVCRSFGSERKWAQSGAALCALPGWFHSPAACFGAVQSGRNDFVCYLWTPSILIKK
jgi:hypothetical protein